MPCASRRWHAWTCSSTGAIRCPRSWRTARPGRPAASQHVEDTSFVGTFLHIVAGYHGAGYGFLWDQALRDDLFTGFGDDLLSPSAGARYRATVLDAAWTQPPVDRVARFLGRPWSTAALLDRTGA